MCKEDCQATKEEAKELGNFVQKYRAKWDQLEIDGDEGLVEAFGDLGRYTDQYCSRSCTDRMYQNGV